MGKTSRFFRALFGFKASESSNQLLSDSDVDKQIKRRWSFFKSHRDKPHHHLSSTFDASLTRPHDTPLHRRFSDHTGGGDRSTNHAAAEVVGVTSRTTTAGADYGLPGVWAAVKIQTYFRAYLARKALRALRSLVKLQALVRGHIQRKQAADELRRLQALVRVQARARACRFQMTESPQSTTKGPPTPEKFEDNVHRSRIIKHNQPSMLKHNGEKILELDATKPHTRRRTLFQPDQIGYSQSQSLTTSRGSTFYSLGPSPSSSCEVSSLTAPFKCFPEEQVSPPFYANEVMRVCPFTSAKSESSDHPNYMAYTESSRAKVRSLSAPRQRPNLEFPSTTKRYSVYGYGSGTQRGSNLRDSFVSKAYPGSGRLDRLGMPIGSGYWN